MFIALIMIIEFYSGNRWNCDKNNRCGKGRGAQEEFFGCADIEILPKGTQFKHNSNQMHSTFITEKQNNKRVINRGPNKNKVARIKSNGKNKNNFRPNINFRSDMRNDMRKLDHYTRQLILNNLTREEQSLIPRVMDMSAEILGKANKDQGFKMFKSKLNSSFANSKKKKAILDELSDVLWSLLKAVMQVSDSETGEHVSLVKMSPVGDFRQFSDIAHKLTNENRRKKWPPLTPIVVEANIGLDDVKDGQPVILSEMTALEDVRKRAKNTKKIKSNVSAKKDGENTFKCEGIRHHRFVKGISEWCTSNCRQGNCPGAICICKTTKQTDSAIKKATQKGQGANFENPMSLNEALLSVNNFRNQTRSTLDNQRISHNGIAQRKPRPLSNNVREQKPAKKERLISYNEQRFLIDDGKSLNMKTEKKRAMQTVNKPSKQLRNILSTQNKKDRKFIPKPIRTNPTRKIIYNVKEEPLERIDNLSCEGVGEFSRTNKMNTWCIENCSKGFCPERLCRCKYPTHL